MIVSCSISYRYSRLTTTLVPWHIGSPKAGVSRYFVSQYGEWTRIYWRVQRLMLHPGMAHLFHPEVNLATVLDEGLIGLTATEGGSPGPDIVGHAVEFTRL